MGVAVSLHVLAVVIWVGGMFFAYTALRPVAAAQLQPAARLTLWAGVFGRFFPWVWASVVVVLSTGWWMIFAVLGGFAGLTTYLHIMLTLGSVMVAIFLYVFFSPYQGLRLAVAAQEWPRGALHLARIRVLVGINTSIGMLTTAIASGGRYLAF